MTQPNVPRVLEPTAAGSGAGVKFDWRGTNLDSELEAARGDARDALGAALSIGTTPTTARAMAWAAAALALQHCLDLALDRIYGALGAERPSAREVPTDLAARDPRVGALVTRVLTAPDARTGYVFLEDLLGHLDRAAL